MGQIMPFYDWRTWRIVLRLPLGPSCCVVSPELFGEKAVTAVKWGVFEL